MFLNVDLNVINIDASSDSIQKIVLLKLKIWIWIIELFPIMYFHQLKKILQQKWKKQK
jgi:hypothetical protein